MSDMATLTLDDLRVPLRALRLLLADFGHLSAPCVGISTVYPDRLELSFHDDLEGFQAWRKGLGIAPEAVTEQEQGGSGEGRTRVLLASVTYVGAAVKLTAFDAIPTPGGAL